ncbi:hypothetical protein F4808DRAFT_456702 [Astrocystis sublimbata]|nr:hypothetical protein F4808DRAFT_456702 [Astrocystis sublimbata]
MASTTTIFDSAKAPSLPPTYGGGNREQGSNSNNVNPHLPQASHQHGHAGDSRTPISTNPPNLSLNNPSSNNANHASNHSGHPNPVSSSSSNPPPPHSRKSSSGDDHRPLSWGAHNNGTNDNDEHGDKHRLMRKGEWLQFCRGVGILKDEESEEVIRATSRMWPPRGFKDGLYNDILYEKTKYTYYYHALSIIAWILMLLQLALSAILTALGATSSSNGTPITIIAAINTGVAGILALLHNSGLPDRYRWDRNEFYKTEEHIKAIVDTGLIPATHGVNDVLAECFDMFATALQTVQNNAPTMYSSPGGVPKPQQQQSSHTGAAARLSQKLAPKK